MTEFLRDPAVVAWQIALAPRPREVVGHHWWRETVTTHHRNARDAWEQLRESGPFLQFEDEEFRRAFPPPTLRDAMVGLARGRSTPQGWSAGI